MRYEKKMLILSGNGKGIVLMEKSALGVKFALRTFSVPAAAGLKAGVVTRSCVTVRELPNCADPSLVFYIDDSAIDLSCLHFAVFDSALILYGATCKRMWESNLMDLLVKAERLTAPPSMLAQSLELEMPAVPHFAAVLPEPDGSGNPQLRAVYGDDAIAGENFYTPFEMSPRMKEVDGFLDTPRILDGLAPLVAASTKSALPDSSKAPFSTDRAHRAAVDEGESEKSSTAEDKMFKTADKSDSADKSVVADCDAADMAHAQACDCAVRKDADVMPEAAAAASVEQPIPPWKRTAQYLKSLDSVELVIGREAVTAVAPKTQVKHVREATFFERCRADVDKLFASAAKDGELNALLPDVEWVKVPFDGHAVSVGRGGDVFLCYAVPGVYAKASPLGGEAQWLPKHKSAPTGRGYWLIFQDLKSGAIIGV